MSLRAPPPAPPAPTAGQAGRLSLVLHTGLQHHKTAPIANGETEAERANRLARVQHNLRMALAEAKRELEPYRATQDMNVQLIPLPS